MNRTLTVSLSDAELFDLHRIILDRDQAGALAFLDRYLRKQATRVLEGAGKVMPDVSGAAVIEVGAEPRPQG